MAENDDSDVQTDPMVEINAIKGVAEALEGLDPAAVARVLRWANEKFGIQLRVGGRQVATTMSGESIASGGANSLQQFEQLPDFYAACNPQTDADKALAVGFWVQFKEGNPDFDTQRVNSELKQLGYPIGNITRAFDNLEALQPKLVIQVKKLGSTKQARKRLKLTVEGKKAVELMLSTNST